MLKRTIYLLTFIAIVAGPASAQYWVNFVEDGMRLMGASSLTGGDIEEKDMWARDFDMDGDTDLVVVRKTPPPYQTSGPRQHVLFVNQGGVLTDMTSALSPDFLTNHSDARDVRGADFDNDGDHDLIVVNTFDQNPQLYVNLGLDTQGNWLGFQLDMTGRIPNFVSPTVGPMFCEVAIADYDQNGWLDMYFTDYTNNLEDRLIMGNLGVNNNGQSGPGTWVDESVARVTSAIRSTSFGTGVQTADMNNDGWADIIRSSGAGAPNAIRIAFNDGTGNFSQFQDLPVSVPYMHNIIDINKDGRQDVYVVSDAQDRYVINNATLSNQTIDVTTVTLNTSPATTGFGGNIKIADLDRDGYDDVVVNDVDIDVAGCNRRLTVLRNMSGLGTQSGGWQLLQDKIGVQTSWMPNGTHDSEVLDIDGDGWLDLVVGSCTGTRVFMQVPQLALAFGQPAPTTAAPMPGLEVHVRGGGPGARHFVLISLQPVNPGSGTFFGLGQDSFQNFINLANIPPLDVILDANGNFDFTVPPPLPPIAVQVRGLELPPVPGQPARVSNVVTPVLY